MEANNTKAMREALEKLQKLVTSDRPADEVEIANICRAALSAPARNCDVGTAEDQIDLMLAFCGRKGKCTKCEHYKIGTTFRECTLRWAQMPYEEGGAA